MGIHLLLLTLVTTAAYGQRLTLTPSLTVGEVYDDNIFQTRTNKQDDFITTISPGIRVQYLSPQPTPETQLDFDYRANAELFADNTSQNHLGHYGSLTFKSQLTPSLALQVRDLLVVTEEPFGRNERLDNPTGLRPISQERRALTRRNQAEAALDVRLGGRTSLGVQFASLIEDVDVPEELDEFRYTVGTELGYLVDVARESRVFVTYQVTFHLFRDNGVVLPASQSEDFQVHAVQAGWRHDLTPTLTVSAALGYAFVNSTNPANDGNGGVVANLDLTKTFQLGQASLGYVRQITSGEGEGGSVIADTVSAMVSINLTGKLTARLDTNVSWFDFQRVVLSSEGDRLFWSVRPGLTYQITRPWSASVAYAYELTDFTNNVADRSDHLLLVGTQFALREWLFLGLSYNYSSRKLHGDTVTARLAGTEDSFTRNQITLTVTAKSDVRLWR